MLFSSLSVSLVFPSYLIAVKQLTLESSPSLFLSSAPDGDAVTVQVLSKRPKELAR
jgi:hypothetical protein